MKKCLMITVCGKVQGVGFRYSALNKAHELNLTGFVKNRSDGSVYIEAEGESENLDQFIDWLNRGPAWAMVEDIDIQIIPNSNFSNFVIK
ncbi:MAG: acylphosphatase [Bacteroidales bacterium]